jgi:hypothetical protein
LFCFIKIFFLLFFILSVPISAFAQAYINPKGSGTFSISYQNAYVKDHLFGKGQDVLPDPRTGELLSALGQVRTQAVFFNVEYSITDKFAVSGGLPYITSKFIADGPVGTIAGPHIYHLPDGDPNPINDPIVTNPDGTYYIPVDDGEYHGGLQDLSARVRYNILSVPFLVTPFIEYSAPTHDYPFYSHAVIGNRVSEFRIGTYVGGSLQSILPNTTIQARYAFGIPQRILGISRTRHQGEVDVAYSVSDTVTVFGVLLGQVTVGGLDLLEDFRPLRTYNPKFLHHLQIQRDNLLDVGVGGQYSLNDRTALFGVLVHTLTARNMHAFDYVLTFGMSWSFNSTPIRPCNC